MRRLKFVASTCRQVYIQTTHTCAHTHTFILTLLVSVSLSVSGYLLHAHIHTTFQRMGRLTSQADLLLCRGRSLDSGEWSPHTVEIQGQLWDPDVKDSQKPFRKDGCMDLGPG